MAVFHIFDLSFLLFGMLDTSYTCRGLLCKGLSSQSVDGVCVLFGSPLDDRASHDTNLQFSSVVPEVSIFCYFGILDNGLCHSHKNLSHIKTIPSIIFVGMTKTIV